MNRRDFVWLSAASAFIAVRSTRLIAETSPNSVTLRIGERTNLTMPSDFIGLSYESAQLAHPVFFSSDNKKLIAMFAVLGNRGVLRLGGNTSEFTRWSATNSPDTASASAVNPDAGKGKSIAIVTPQAIRNLRDFLDATGWRCIYGLNLAHGTPEQAAVEAKFVSETLRERLIALQIGNEPDLYSHNWRPPTYDFSDYIGEWNKFAATIRTAVPDAKFAGPDVAENYQWVMQFAAQHSPDTVMLTGHYYAEGPPSDPKMTIDYLLRPPPRLLAEIPIVMQAAHDAKLPYRMAEGNSCYWGGKPGVSDTFASALWSGDYILQLARAGYAGINLHGGGTGVYTPIAGDPATGYTAQPVLYGMELANEFAGATFVATSLDAKGMNLTAYAAELNSRLLLTIFNKDAASAPVKLAGRPFAAPYRTRLLRAPAIDSKQNVSFTDGRLEIRPSPGPTVAFHVPAYTGVLLQFGK